LANAAGSSTPRGVSQAPPPSTASAGRAKISVQTNAATGLPGSPNTGTPVPGGLDWHECGLWLTELARSGRRIVGLDLVEVSPGPVLEAADAWDAIVGARLLYRLIGAALMTRS